MKRLFLAAAAALTIATAAFAESHEHGEEHVALGEVEWVDAPIPGVQLAYMYGDDATTGARWLIKMDPGVALPMHTHTSDYWGMTIVGNWVHVQGDGSETPTGPGDYALVKGGDVHADRCDSEVACIGLLDFAGPRDVMVAQ